MNKTHRCNQCWKEKPLSAFPPNALHDCKRCRAMKKAGIRRGRSPELDRPGLRVHFKATSFVHKLGGIPASSTSGVTCPDSCSLKGAGCYAEFGSQGSWWRALSRGDGRRPRGSGRFWLDWEGFCAQVRRLSRGQLWLWRHNLAGDLPGTGDDVDVERLVELVMANLLARARGFTFTHKPVLRSRHAAMAVRGANAYGFAVNLSADSPHHADALAALDIGPVVTVLDTDAPAKSATPAGRPIYVCPAQRDPAATCASCGWCARRDRDWIVGFRAHGQMREAISLRVLS